MKSTCNQAAAAGHDVFPLIRSAAALGLLLVAWAWAVLWVVELTGLASLEPGVVAFVAGVVWVTAGASLWPVWRFGGLGVMATVWAYFAGGAVRLAACLAASLWAIRANGWAAEQVLLLLVAFYLPVLLAEAGMVGRYLWMKDGVKDGAAARRGVCSC